MPHAGTASMPASWPQLAALSGMIAPAPVSSSRPSAGPQPCIRFAIWNLQFCAAAFFCCDSRNFSHISPRTTAFYLRLCHQLPLSAFVLPSQAASGSDCGQLQLHKLKIKNKRRKLWYPAQVKFWKYMHIIFIFLYVAVKGQNINTLANKHLFSICRSIGCGNQNLKCT